MNNKEKIIKSLDLIKESWTIYQNNLLKFIEVIVYGLIGVVPLLIVLFLFFAYGATGLINSASIITNFILGSVGVIFFFIGVYLAIVYSLQAKVAALLLLKNNFTPAKDNFAAAKPYINKFLGVSLLTIVLVIAWGFVFIVPALIFAIYYCFATYVVVLEDKRPFSAVERSYDLTHGYWWPVFGRLVLIFILGIALYLLASWPLSKMVKDSAPYTIYGTIINILWAVLSPYFVIYLYKIYESLKKVNK